jgi:branched-chain amino acid transport system substrate-binding protein
VHLDLSGRYSSFGKSTLNGVKLAPAEINNRATEGRRVELIIEDDSGRADEAATVVQRLINQQTIDALPGDIISSNALTTAPIAQYAKVPMITSATHPAVTEVGNYTQRCRRHLQERRISSLCRDGSRSDESRNASRAVILRLQRQVCL